MSLHPPERLNGAQSKGDGRLAKLMGYYVYILECSDHSYYTGSAQDLNRTLVEHQEGSGSASYTSRRRPVQLVWSEEVSDHNEALLHEHQIKGWTRAKKEALSRGDFPAIHEIVRRERRVREQRQRRASPSTAPEARRLRSGG